MNTVTIYSTQRCVYCDRAKAFLRDQNIAYEEIAVDTDTEKLQEMLRKSNGMRSVPQIFIGEHHIGGYQELVQCAHDKKLEALIKGA